MNKRQAKIEALDIAAQLLWQEAQNPSEVALRIDEDDLEKVYDALQMLALDLQERCGKLVQRGTKKG
jgi:hypothetical protein